MIYSIPLSDIKMIKSEDGTVYPLGTTMFGVSAEFQAISPSDRYKDSKTWIFDIKTDHTDGVWDDV